jgi:hypothetical protein
MNLHVPQNTGNSLKAERLLASQDRLCQMEGAVINLTAATLLSFVILFTFYSMTSCLVNASHYE